MYSFTKLQFWFLDLLRCEYYVTSEKDYNIYFPYNENSTNDQTLTFSTLGTNIIKLRLSSTNNSSNEELKSDSKHPYLEQSVHLRLKRNFWDFLEDSNSTNGETILNEDDHVEPSGVEDLMDMNDVPIIPNENEKTQNEDVYEIGKYKYTICSNNLQWL